MYAIYAFQHPKFPNDRYYWTGNHGDGYPPPWSWRKDMALRFPTMKIAEKWLFKLRAEEIRSNDGDRIPQILAIELKD